MGQDQSNLVSRVKNGARSFRSPLGTLRADASELIRENRFRRSSNGNQDPQQLENNPHEDNTAGPSRRDDVASRPQSQQQFEPSLGGDTVGDDTEQGGNTRQLGSSSGGATPWARDVEERGGGSQSQTPLRQAEEAQGGGEEQGEEQQEQVEVQPPPPTSLLSEFSHTSIIV